MYEPLRSADDSMIPTPEATGAATALPLPLVLFSNDECRAWIAALLALRSTRPAAAPRAMRRLPAREAGDILNSAIAYAAAVPCAAFSQSRGQGGGDGVAPACPTR